jgi:hypothetical protein
MLAIPSNSKATVLIDGLSAFVFSNYALRTDAAKEQIEREVVRDADGRRDIGNRYRHKQEKG